VNDIAAPAARWRAPAAILHRVLVFLALVAGAFAARADSADQAESGQSPDGLRAQLILVRDDQQLLKLWNAPGATPDVATVRSVSVGEQASAFVLFSGCAPNPSGHCDVTVRFNVHQPNGRIFATTPPMEVWQYKPAPPARKPQLSVEYLKFVVEPRDPLGQYTVSANVKDHVSGASLQLSTAFAATK